MKILSIYADIRKSSEMTIETKRDVYKKLYTQFSSYKPKKNNISFRDKKYVGDGKPGKNKSTHSK